TLHASPDTPFTLPSGARRNAGIVMLQAFQESVAELSKALGNNPHQWQWGKLHTRTVDSLLGVEALSYGPRASGGDEWTLNAAGGSPLSESSPMLNSSAHGPSWRIIVDWGTGQALGSYPGGQDENP